jgi:hypothetical protein
MMAYSLELNAFPPRADEGPLLFAFWSYQTRRTTFLRS